MTPSFRNLDFSNLKIFPVMTSGSSKTAPIWLGQNKHVEWALPWLPVCFEPSVIGGSTSKRLSLCLTPTPEVTDFYSEFDLAMVRAIAIDSVKLFGKPISTEQVGLMYQSSLCRSNRLSHIRCKIQRWDSEARGRENYWASRFWNESNEELPGEYWPETWVGQEARITVVASSIWLANGRVGVTLSAPHLQVRPIQTVPEAPATCPFEEEAEEAA
jgi:hypothetical protein